MHGAEIQIPNWLRGTEIILEALNEGVAIVDDQLRVVFANEALIRLGGYERGELCGRTPDSIFPPEDLPYLLQQHAAAQRYGHHRHEFYLPHKDGQRVPVIYSGRLIPGPDGQQYGLIILTDISAQKRVEEQLRHSNARLEKRQREIEAELALAARVQQSLAPRSLVWSNIAVEAYYSPASTIVVKTTSFCEFHTENSQSGLKACHFQCPNLRHPASSGSRFGRSGFQIFPAKSVSGFARH